MHAAPHPSLSHSDSHTLTHTHSEHSNHSHPETWKQLRQQHHDATELDPATSRQIKSNIFAWYHERHQEAHQIDPDGEIRFRLADKFASIIFSMHASAAGNEYVWSRTKYIKNKNRSSLGDARTSSLLHLAMMPDHDDIEKLPNTLRFVDTEHALLIPDLKDELRKKYLGKRIQKRFKDGNLYSGTIKLVEWVESESSYQLLVKYDDGDSEHLEQHEMLDTDFEFIS